MKLVKLLKLVKLMNLVREKNSEVKLLSFSE